MANTDDDNLSELLDDDKLEGMQFPPDRPLGLTDDNGIVEGQDSLEDRMRREIPEREGSGVRDEDIGTLVDPTPGFDDEADAVATAVPEGSSVDQLGLDTTAQDLEEIEPAEEAAMHLTADPPLGDGDGYLD